MKKFQALKNKKGFTLVELLVALVILVILAAALIPSMLGFIDKAREDSATAECKSVLLAASVVLNEQYGKGSIGSPVAGDELNKFKIDIANLADTTGNSDDIVTIIIADNTADGAATTTWGRPYISSMTYKASNSKTYKYTAAANEWVVQ